MQHVSNSRNWYLFTIPTRKVLEYIEQSSSKPFPSSPESGMEAQRWHLALRRGLRSHLHLDVGIPGQYAPDHPVIENDCALHAALLLGQPTMQVILSGEWEEALRLGLISKDQLARHEAALAREMLTGA